MRAAGIGYRGATFEGMDTEAIIARARGGLSACGMPGRLCITASGSDGRAEEGGRAPSGIRAQSAHRNYGAGCQGRTKRIAEFAREHKVMQLSSASISRDDRTLVKQVREIQVTVVAER